jgi:Cys-tRNA(Pro) deacylase
MTQITTRITALLDESGVAYRVLPHLEPVFTVEAAAAQRGVRQEEMVKSILLRDRNGRYVMACVMGDAQLDPKAVRDFLPEYWKRLSFATRDEIFEVTGYVQGAVAPLGLPMEVPVLFDEAIGRLEQVNISSGDPMAGLELRPSDLIRLARAILAPIAKCPDAEGDR